MFDALDVCIGQSEFGTFAETVQLHKQARAELAAMRHLVVCASLKQIFSLQ